MYNYIYIYIYHLFPPENQIYSVDQYVIYYGYTVHAHWEFMHRWLVDSGNRTKKLMWFRQNRPSKLPGPEVECEHQWTRLPMVILRRV